jgi:hypothetical protein
LTILGVIVCVASMQGQSPAHYRDFQLGGDLASVSALTGVAASEAKTVRSRPAILQELQWRRPYSLSETAVDPVEPLDERNAPQRERARVKKEADDERAAKEKARFANEAAFRP